MNKYGKGHYVAIQICKDGRYHAYVDRVTECTNLLSALNVPNIVSANMCDSCKRANEIVADWNETHRAQDRHLYFKPRNC